VHAVLRNALQAAVREEIVQRNVAKLVQVRGATYDINRGVTEEQARVLLLAAKATRLYALFVLALFLGLRRGELLGLKWEDIDFAEGKGGGPAHSATRERSSARCGSEDVEITSDGAVDRDLHGGASQPPKAAGTGAASCR
jgi:integrase